MNQGRRILYALVGVLVMLLAGFVYAWSILSAPIAADFPQWSNSQLSLTFTLCITFFCLGGTAAGLLSRRIPVRVNVLLSAGLFLAGFFITSRTQSLSTLYLGYGVLCGTASGFAYNSVMNVMPRWFPDRQGLISGVLLMGFGASSMVIGSAFTALTPSSTGAWRGSLLFMGITMAVVLAVSALFFRIPKANELPATKEKATGNTGLERSPGEILVRPSFWLFFLWAALLAAAGLVIIAQARNLALTAAPGFSASALSFAVGLISVCNGLGRVIFGGLFDRLGRRTTMLLVTASLIAGAVLLPLSLLASAPALLIAGFVMTGLGYGGSPTMGAAFVKAAYGQKHYAVNFSLMNLNLLVASFAGTAAGAIYDATGSFTVIFILLIFLLAAALAAMLFIRKV